MGRDDCPMYKLWLSEEWLGPNPQGGGGALNHRGYSLNHNHCKVGVFRGQQGLLSFPGYSLFKPDHKNVI